MDYQGELDKSGKATGIGRLYFPFVDEIFYQGNFTDGKMCGSGRFFYVNQTILYEGNVKNDSWTGSGIKYHNDGYKIYDGNF